MTTARENFEIEIKKLNVKPSPDTGWLPYSLDKLYGEQYCLKFEKGKWTVFWYERGNRYDCLFFDEEKQAFDALFNLVKSSIAYP
jgi:hypothetical protein